MTTPERSRRILLVEDDAWIRTFIRDVLSDEGYEVTEAADGRTGLRLAADNCPDLVLLDLAMPESSGVDVLHQLKKVPVAQSAPVLIISAYARVLSDSDATSVAGVLTKPLDVGRLLVAIQSALSGDASREPAKTASHRRKA
jgi:DNA-binding response OmpR family regulator